MYIAVYPNMDKKTYISFEEFRNKNIKPKLRKTDKENKDVFTDYLKISYQRQVTKNGNI